eukprot:10344644-Ditylum_brightwellii.AAC.1
MKGPGLDRTPLPLLPNPAMLTFVHTEASTTPKIMVGGSDVAISNFAEYTNAIGSNITSRSG